MKELETHNVAVVLIDVQEKLIPAMSGIEPLLDRIKLLLSGATALGVDVLVSEQYPKGLGKTLPDVTSLIPSGTVPVEKSSFSVFGSPEFRTALSARRRETLIFAGVESHVCVLQSVLDARAAGYNVFLAADAVSSRKDSDVELAIAAARSAGVTVLSVESILFMLLGDSKHPAFKTISRLVK